jgi:hypothetical protein
MKQVIELNKNKKPTNYPSRKGDIVVNERTMPEIKKNKKEELKEDRIEVVIIED